VYTSLQTRCFLFLPPLLILSTFCLTEEGDRCTHLNSLVVQSGKGRNLETWPTVLEVEELPSSNKELLPCAFQPPSPQTHSFPTAADKTVVTEIQPPVELPAY